MRLSLRLLCLETELIVPVYRRNTCNLLVGELRVPCIREVLTDQPEKFGVCGEMLHDRARIRCFWGIESSLYMGDACDVSVLWQSSLANGMLVRHWLEIFLFCYRGELLVRGMFFPTRIWGCYLWQHIWFVKNRINGGSWHICCKRCLFYLQCNMLGVVKPHYW